MMRARQLFVGMEGNEVGFLPLWMSLSAVDTAVVSHCQSHGEMHGIEGK
jgi:hypothetical protein